MPRAEERQEARLCAALRLHLSGHPLHIAEADRTVWGWFAELASTRSYHPGGPNPIAYAEIEAYARLHRWPLGLRHIAAIRALDRAWLEHVRAGAGKGNIQTVPRSSGQAVNPAAFDAVFR